MATKFRETIERMDASLFPCTPHFSDYPSGCCGDTSNLLLQFLYDNGIKSEYVNGSFYEDVGDHCRERSHAWLEIEDYIVDITADQFDDVSEKAFVTQDKSWHSKFKEQQRRFETLEDAGPSEERLKTIYQNILDNIGG